MKKISILSAICVLSLASFAFGQTHTQNISFDDTIGPGNAGTYISTDHFSMDLYLTFAGYNSIGFDVWLETAANAAANVLLTGFTYGTAFVDPTQPSASYPMGFTLLQSNGLYTTPNPSDLGATQDPPYSKTALPPGTYFIGTLSIDLNGLAPGIYTLQTDAAGFHASQVTSFDGTTFDSNYMPTATYTITVVPEPTAFSLLIVTALGLAVCICRGTLSKRSFS